MAFLPALVAGKAAVGTLTDGLNYSPNGANITNPVSPQDASAAIQSQIAAGNTTQSGIAQQQAFTNALAAQNGLGHQQDVYGQQQALLGQYGQIAAGQGPNPAQAQLAQATSANVANQAALLAGQRGSGANVGLAGRQAAMAGGNIQQQAAGQAATLQANQSLAAMQAEASQQAALAGTAQNQISNQAGGLQALNAAAQGAQGLAINNQNSILNSIGQKDSTSAGATAAQNQVNEQQAQAKVKLISDLFGGVAKGAGAAAGMAHGGMVQKFADGGQVANLKENTSPSGQNHVLDFLLGGKTPMKMAQGGPVVGEMLAARGAVVPGQAQVAGDSLKNDTVNAKLSPGEVVIPRSIMQSANPAAEAAKFVQAVMAKNGLKR